MNFHLSSSSCHSSLAISRFSPLSSFICLLSPLSSSLVLFCLLLSLSSSLVLFYLLLSLVPLPFICIPFLSLCYVCSFSMLCMSLYYSDRLSSSSSFRSPLSGLLFRSFSLGLSLLLLPCSSPSFVPPLLCQISRFSLISSLVYAQYGTQSYIFCFIYIL